MDCCTYAVHLYGTKSSEFINYMFSYKAPDKNLQILKGLDGCDFLIRL